MKISIGNVYTKVISCSENEHQLLETLLTCEVPNFRFMTAYKQGRWDGKKHFYSRDSRSFLSGFIPLIMETFEKRRWDIQVVDARILCPIDIGNLNRDNLRWYQEESITRFLQNLLYIDGKDIPWIRGVFRSGTGTGKTAFAARFIDAIQVRTLYVVERLDALYQSREEFQRWSDLPTGIIGDGVFEPATVTFSMVQTLRSRMTKLKEFFSHIQFLLFDECHLVGQNDYHKIALRCSNASVRVGISATPMSRNDVGDVILVGDTGDVVAETDRKLLEEQGYLAKSRTMFFPVTSPIDERAPFNHAYQHLIVENEGRNRLIVRHVQKLLKMGCTIFVLTRLLKHGKILMDMLAEVGVDAVYVSGKDASSIRQEVLTRMGEKYRVVVVSSLPKQEFVLVKGSISGIRLIQIGDFVKNKFFEEEWECWTRLSSGVDGWARITNVIAHPRNNVPIVKTALKSGVHILTTDNHALIGKNYESVFPCDATEIHASLSGPLCDRPLQYIDVVERLYNSPEKNNFYIRIHGATISFGLSIRGASLWLSGECGADKRTNENRELWIRRRYGTNISEARVDVQKFLKHCYYSHGKMVCALPESVSELEYLFRLGLSADVRWFRSRTNAKLPLRIEITPELAGLAGVFVAEGHTGFYDLVGAATIAAKRTHKIDDRPGFRKKLGIRRYILDAAHTIGLPKPSITKLQIVWHQRIMSCFFRYVLDVGGKSNTKRIPYFVWNSDDKVREEFLYGYFLGDGHFDQGKKKCLVFTTVSRELAIGVNYLLMSFGCKTGVYIDRMKHGKSNFRRYVVHCLSDFFGYSLGKTRNQPKRGLTRKVFSVIEQSINSDEVYDLCVENVERFYGGFGVLAHNSIFDQSINVPVANAAINAAAGKSRIKSIQKSGRVLRPKENGKNVAYYLDYLDKTNRYLLSHSLERMDAYRSEGFAVRVMP